MLRRMAVYWHVKLNVCIVYRHVHRHVCRHACLHVCSHVCRHALGMYHTSSRTKERLVDKTLKLNYRHVNRPMHSVPAPLSPLKYRHVYAHALKYRHVYAHALKYQHVYAHGL